MEPIFSNRSEAGRELARSLLYLKSSHPVVIGVPRGGILIAAEVARGLEAPIDLMIVRRIAAPGHPDVIVGAVVDGPQSLVLCDEAALAAHGVSRMSFEAEVLRVQSAIAMQMLYATGRPRCRIRNRAVIVAEDTIASGSTARIAARALYQEGVGHVIIASPVAVDAAVTTLRDECDELVVLARLPETRHLRSCYADFRQITDADVARCLKEMPAPFT